MKVWSSLGLLFVITTWSEVASADLVFQLTTPTHIAFVINHCESGVLDCRDVEYLGVNKKTGKSVHLKGRSILSGNAGNWRGYKFADSDLQYRIYIEGERADLRISRDRKEIENELGTFVGI